MQAIHDWVSTVARAFLHFRQYQTFPQTIPRLPQPINESMVSDYFRTLEEPAFFRERMKTYISNARSRQWLEILSHESSLPYASAYRQNVWHGLSVFGKINVGAHEVMQDLVSVLINAPIDPLEQCVAAARIVLWERVTGHQHLFHERLGEVIAAWLFGLITVQVRESTTRLYILLVVFYFKFIAEPTGIRVRNNFPDGEYAQFGLSPPDDSHEAKPYDDSQIPSSQCLESVKQGVATELLRYPYDREM